MTQYNNLWLNEIAKKHKQWLATVHGIGGDMYAKDIVQEIDISLDKLAEKRGTHDFMIGNEKLTNGYVYYHKTIIY